MIFFFCCSVLSDKKQKQNKHTNKKHRIHTLGTQRGNRLSLHHKHAQKMSSKNLYIYIILCKNMFPQGKRKRKKKLWVLKKEISSVIMQRDSDFYPQNTGLERNLHCGGHSCTWLVWACCLSKKNKK